MRSLGVTGPLTFNVGETPGRNDVAHLHPVDIAPLLRQVPGKWVALHNGEIIEVRETLDALTVALEERGLSDVTVLRAPTEGETEMVGLG